MTFEESFEQWLNERVRRAKSAIFINYSNMQARWDSQWWTEDRERAHRKYWEDKGVKVTSARVKGPR